MSYKKSVRKGVITVFAVVLVFTAAAQSAKEHFNKASKALTEGDAASCLQYLDKAQSKLKGSNPKIEALKAQAFAAQSDWVNAKIAYNNYTQFVPAGNDSEAGRMMEDLGAQIEDGLAKIQTDFEEKKDTEKQESLKEVEAAERSVEQTQARKLDRLNDVNGQKLNDRAISTGDRTFVELLKSTPNKFANMDGDWNQAVSRNTTESYTDFLKKYPRSIYTQQANDALARIEKRKREAASMYEDVRRRMSIGVASYRNYNAFRAADSVASFLFGNYYESEMGQSRYRELTSSLPKIKEFYKWNREYYQKRDDILKYDQMTVELGRLYSKYERKSSLDTDAGLVVQATMVAIGGIVTGMGLFGGDAFAKNDRKNMVTYGGAAFAIGMTWIILDFRSTKVAYNRYSRMQNRVRTLKSEIGPVLEKREQSIDSVPLINQQ